MTTRQNEQFEQYYELLIQWNEKINLTAITDRDEVWTKHFQDSISILDFCEFSNEKLIDVGTGAGFPGLPLGIMCPDLQITLLDSLNKRVDFLNVCIEKLSLMNVTAVHGRAEDFAHNKDYRGQFDFAVSRAVAKLSVLSEYCIPFLREGGMFLPYKSMKSDDEILEASNALDLLGAKYQKKEEYFLGEDMYRSILFIEKILPTADKYPRKAGKPTKKPL